ncbi:Hypothetical protein SMAX5B_021196 [Scophthalmus maximus]|uniref:Uncharacterized protein n=1 Tax=Scophthalmus maximus TaxID=52904 RepID=A0A2U9BLZ8_SCOMX|nr:Hypothetical protein SMAX5B_021196 [Scophthalmus maximus]
MTHHCPIERQHNRNMKNPECYLGRVAAGAGVVSGAAASLTSAARSAVSLSTASWALGGLHNPVVLKRRDPSRNDPTSET